MRKLLATAAALAPLMVATGVQAEVVVSTARTTPILTSNATGTAADNIRLASGGSVAVTTGAAITVDSNHTVDLDSGSNITMANAADGATGILVTGGRTTSVTVGGAISITDSIETYTDTDSDGDADGPFAAGTGRYGVRVAGPMTGSIVGEAGGTIGVQGNNSYGVSVEGPLTGSIRLLSGINVTGDNVYGLRTTGTVSGDVLLSSGAVAVQGANAVGVAVDAAVSGGVQIQSAISATGYRYTSRPPSLPANTTNVVAANLYVEDLDADDLLQGGPAVRIAADVAGGVLLDTAPIYRLGIEGDDDHDGVKNGDEDDDGDGTKNRDDTDRDGDGILDTNEGTASLTSLGGAPALLIGSTTQAITIGAVGTGEEAYGVVNRGSITGSGIYDGIAAQGLRVGTGQAVTIAGGVNNLGTINANSAAANSTAVLFDSGVTAPTLLNSGSISGVAVTEGIHTAAGVLIAAGANLPSIVNSGVISAGVSGEKADAVGIRDLSGTLTSLTNTGVITGFIVPNDDAKDTDDSDIDPSNEVVTGQAIAFDVRANTTGVTFVQSGKISDGRFTDTDGDGKYDFEDDDDDGDGILDNVDSSDNDDDNDGTNDTEEPLTSGAILLGSGADVLDIRNGQVLGDLSFGAGADSLLVSGGAEVRGVLSDSDGQLNINVSNGLLDARQTTAVDVTGLSIGADGNLLVTVDPEGNKSGGFNVAGTATLADGAALGVRFTSLITDPERFTIIKADTLNYGVIDPNSVQANSPYLFVVSAGADVAAGEVYIDARRRTAAEIGLIPVEAQAFDAVYAALGDSTAIRNAFVSQLERDGFINLYQQMLPDHSGGPLLSLASGVDAVTRALTGRNASAGPGETSAWVQEINFYAEKDKTDSYGFESEGFGVAGGVERGTNMGAFGVSVAFTSSDLEDPEARAEEVLSASLLELGLYWRAQGENWTTWARAAAGYATFESERSLVGDGIYLTNESSWNGMTLALAAGASYERNFGRLNIRPEGYVEYFGLNEDGHTEEGGGDGFDLDIDKRDGHMFSAVAAVNIGYGFGTNGWIRPELRLGWRQNISVDMGETVARFASGGSDFKLTPASIEGGGPIAGLRLAVGNQLGMLSINADAEMLEDYVRYTLLLRASFRF